MTFPDDSIQQLCLGDWWEATDDKHIQRGSLIWAFVAYPSQEPLVIEPTGRKEPQGHGGAHVEIKKLRISDSRRYLDLPTAALSLDKKECWAAYRAARRPCLVLGCLPYFTNLSRSREKMMARHLRTSTISVIPYYGADQDGSRGGFPPQFIENIRHSRCPQMFYDQLPVDSKVIASILRFDHIQTIGSHHNSYLLTGYSLSVEALEIIDEWMGWFLTGGIPEDGYISQYQDLIKEQLYPH